MPVPLSLDLRTRIAAAVRNGASATEVARRFAVHPATVRRLVRRERETGSLAPTAHRHGPPRTFSPDDDRRVTDLVDARCDLTLGEVADAFEEARTAFRERQPALDPVRLVFVDEAGVNRKMARSHGRAHRSRRAHGRAPAAWGRNTTLVGAMTAAGLVALRRQVGGGTTKRSFLAFVVEDLVPVLRPGQVVVLDNLSAHHAAEVRAAVEAAGCQLLHVPPYSPDLNPIEKAWSKLKAILRGIGARTQEALDEAISVAASAITGSDAANWIGGAGYVQPT